MQIPKNVIEQFANGESEVNDALAVTPDDVNDTEIVGETDSMEEATGEIRIDNNDYDADDDDDVVIVGANNNSEEQTSAYDNYNKIIEEELSGIKSSDESHFDDVTSKLVSEIRAFKKNLIVNEGFTPAEADKAAKARLHRQVLDEKQKYYDEHPEIVNIEVKANDAGKIEFTPEQEEKLIRTNRIRLVTIDDQELSTLKVQEVPRAEKFKIIQKASCSLSHYSLPMYNTRDFMTFNGANIFQLTNAVIGEVDENGNSTETELSLLLKKAQFLFDNFNDSTTRSKYDPEGNQIMTFEDFINWFRFDDIDTGLYCIYVGSSTEMITSAFNCFSRECLSTLNPEDRKRGRQFEATYNSKSIIKYNDAEDSQKEILDRILGAKDNMKEMEQVYNDTIISFRAKSTFTKNVYEFVSPTIKDAIVTLEASQVEASDPEYYINIYTMWTRAIYVYTGDDENGNPSYVKLDSVEEILQYYRTIVETERAMINVILDKKSYSPSFSIKTKCPNCGNEHTINLNIPQLVFLRRRSIEAEITY